MADNTLPNLAPGQPLSPADIQSRLRANLPAYDALLSSQVTQPKPQVGVPETPTVTEVTPEEALRILKAKEKPQPAFWGRSPSELAADRDFNPGRFAVENREILNKVPSARQILAETLEQRRVAIEANPNDFMPSLKDVSLSGAGKMALDFFRGYWDIASRFVRATFDPTMSDEDRQKAKDELLAALDTAQVEDAGLIMNVLKGNSPLTYKVPGLAEMIRDYRQNVRANETPEQRQIRIKRALVAEEGDIDALIQSGKGKGFLAETLGSGGEVDEAAVERMSGAAAVSNYIPFGAGVKGAKLVAKNPLLRAAGNLPTKAVGRTAQGVAKAGEAVLEATKDPLHRGAIGVMLTGDVTGAAAGIASAALRPVTKKVLGKVDEIGANLANNRGFLFGTYDSFVKSPVKGAGAGLLASYPLAALTNDPQEQRSILEAGIGIGGVAGGAVGVGRGGKRTAGWAGAKMAEKLYGDLERTPAQEFAYGSDRTLDQMHQRGQQRQKTIDSQTQGQHVNVIGNLRNRLRYVVGPDGKRHRVEIYNLTEPDFQSVVGEEAAGASVEPIVDSNGQSVYRVFLNADASRGRRQAMFHEPGHVVSRVMKALYPAEHIQLIQQIEKLPAGNRQAFKAL